MGLFGAVGFGAGRGGAAHWSSRLGQGLLCPGRATVFVAVNALIVRRQSAPHTWLLLGSAIVLWLANGSFAWTGMSEAVLAAWFAFLVLTIAAERLEMSRLMRRHPAAHPLLGVVLLALSLGLVGSWMGRAGRGLVWYQPGWVGGVVGRV